jgi:hypothetical protein
MAKKASWNDGRGGRSIPAMCLAQNGSLAGQNGSNGQQCG